MKSKYKLWQSLEKKSGCSKNLEHCKLINGSSKSYISCCGRSESVNVIPPAWPSRLENAPFLTWNNKNLHEIQVSAGGNEICDREWWSHTSTLRLGGTLTHQPHTVPQQLIQYKLDCLLHNIVSLIRTVFLASNEDAQFSLHHSKHKRMAEKLKEKLIFDPDSEWQLSNHLYPTWLMLWWIWKWCDSHAVAFSHHISAQLNRRLILCQTAFSTRKRLIPTGW